MKFSIFEALSYFFFKRRLRKKLQALYQMEDPWSSRELSGVFASLIREQMQRLPLALREAPVLDAGGGEAHFYGPLRDMIKDYHLLDIEEQAIGRARALLGNAPCRLIHQSLDQFHPAADTYGAIWLFNVLTYLGAASHPEIFMRMMKNLWRALKSQGIVLLLHPYYSEKERSALIRQGEFFLSFGGQLIFNNDDRLGKQSFLIQSIKKL